MNQNGITTPSSTELSLRSIFAKSWFTALERMMFLATAVLIPYALYVIFMVVPDERVMGAVQRIFYFHVASAITCYVSFAIVFGASLGVLALKNTDLDAVNEAAGEVGFLFCSLTLLTGMIWAKAAWNTWFRWEPRLVTFLLLWLLFLGFLLLRNFGRSARLPVQSAVVGLVGSLTVPLVWISIKFLPQIAQLHPQIIERQGLKDPLFGYGLLVSVVTLVLFQFVLIVVRTKLAYLQALHTENNVDHVS